MVAVCASKSEMHYRRKMRFRDVCVVRYIHTLQSCLTAYRTTKNANAVPVSMPHTTSDPLRIIRVVRWREEASVRLLARQSLFGRDAVHGLLLSCRVVVPLLLPFLRLSPVVRLSLLAVVDEEGEGGGQADDDEAFEDAVVEFVVVIIVATRYAFRERLVVVVVGGAMVVGVGLFEEIRNPLAEGPFFFGFYIVLGSKIDVLASGFWLTWFRLDRLDLAIRDCVPETSHP